MGTLCQQRVAILSFTLRNLTVGNFKDNNRLNVGDLHEAFGWNEGSLGFVYKTVKATWAGEYNRKFDILRLWVES